MNTYFLEFHNWNLHLPILSFANMFIFCLFWKGLGGRFIVACWNWVFIFLFLSIANKVKIENLYCVKKKNTINLKVSAYACFIKIKGNRKSEYRGCGGLFWNILRFSEHILGTYIPAYFQLTPWCSMPSTSFVIEAFNI